MSTMDLREKHTASITSSIKAKAKDADEWFYKLKSQNCLVAVILDCGSRFGFLGIITFDMLTDIFVGIALLEEGHKAWATLTFFFILLHYIVWGIFGSINWVYAVRQDYGKSAWICSVPLSIALLPAFMLLLFLVDVLLALHTLIPQACKPIPLLGHQWRFARGISEAAVEATPQLVLQVYMFIRSNFISERQLAISIAASLLGITVYTVKAINFMYHTKMGFRRFVNFILLSLQDKGLPLVALHQDVLQCVEVTTDVWLDSHPYWSHFCRLLSKNRGLQRLYIEVRVPDEQAVRGGDTEEDVILLLDALHHHPSLSVIKLNFPCHCMTREVAWSLDALLNKNTVLEMVSLRVKEFNENNTTAKIKERMTKMGYAWPKSRAVEIREVGMGKVCKLKVSRGILFYGGLRLSSKGVERWFGNGKGKIMVEEGDSSRSSAIMAEESTEKAPDDVRSDDMSEGNAVEQTLECIRIEEPLSRDVIEENDVDVKNDNTGEGSTVDEYGVGVKSSDSQMEYDVIPLKLVFR